MRIQVKFFAVTRQLTETAAIEIELPEAATIADVRAALVSRYPALAEIAPHLLFSINAEYASDRTTVPIGAEIGCIPPVSGG